MIKPISLRWYHALAAWWAITWPCWVATTLFLFELHNFSRLSFVQDPANIALALNGLVLIGQGVLLFRLTRKDFSGFSIGVIQGREAVRRRMKIGEQLRVWLQFLFPQLACIAALQLLTFVSLTADLAKTVNSLVFCLRFFVIGPLSVYWAVRADYRDFEFTVYSQPRNLR